MSEHQSFSIRCADHVGFSVGSLDAALRFWVEGLGGRVIRMGEMGGDSLGQTTGARGAHVQMAIVEIAGQTIELLEYSGIDRPAAPARPFDPGFAHLALVVDDLDALLARIVAYGWRAQGVPQVISAGPRVGTKVMYAVGPDGATVEFMQPALGPPAKAG